MTSADVEGQTSPFVEDILSRLGDTSWWEPFRQATANPEPFRDWLRTQSPDARVGWTGDPQGDPVATFLCAVTGTWPWSIVAGSIYHGRLVCYVGPPTWIARYVQALDASAPAGSLVTAAHVRGILDSLE